jgi:Fe-S-cluster containining protein
MLPPLRIKPRREDVPAGECLCEYCTAKCCRYYALPLETPASRKDLDTFRWFMLHERTSLFVDEGTWYLLVHEECRHLQPDGRCGIYETRPKICRDYSIAKCEYDEDWTYEQYFETPEQLEEYIEARFPRRGRALRTPRPGLNLPVLRTVPK